MTKELMLEFVKLALQVTDNLEAYKHLDEPELCEVQLYLAAQDMLRELEAE